MNKRKQTAGEAALGPVLLVTPEKVAEMLSLSRSTVYLLMQRGELKYLKIGRNRRVRLADVEAMIEGAVERRRGE